MIERLRAIAGADLREATSDDAVHGVRPRAVVAPRDTDACAAVLAECSANGWTVEITAARTARGFGRPVDGIDVLLSTERLAGVAEYEPDDLTIGVAAGTAVADLRAKVEAHRQRVPLDPPDARASVGGVLARAVAGPMRRAWSTPRRQVLGIELVTGDGRVLRVGGRVVKNVAGYDLNKLIVGSSGSLGVITRAHLRLLPMPDAAATYVLTAADMAALVATTRELLKAAVEPVALELVGEPWRLIVRYEGSGDTLVAAHELVSRTVQHARAGSERDDHALARLADIEARAALVVRLSALPDRLGELLALAAEHADGCGTIAAHAGDGIVRVLLDEADAATVEPERFADAIDDLRRRVEGSVTVERAPTAIMRRVEPWGVPSEPVMAITRDLKRQFDPAGILQRGRWLA